MGSWINVNKVIPYPVQGSATPKNPVQDCTIFKFGEDCNKRLYNLA